MRNIKKRAWACVFYPESLPNDWEEKLIDSGISCCYALHDKDVNPDGTVKKEHIHVILVYDGPTTYNNVLTFTRSFNAVIPQPLEQVRGYYRYLTHKDNPEKYQYSDDIIHCLNGFDPSDYSDLTLSQTEAILDDLITLIQKNNIFEYSDLVDTFHGDESLSNYSKVIKRNTLFLREYINSRRYKLKDIKEQEERRRKLGLPPIVKKELE